MYREDVLNKPKINSKPLSNQALPVSVIFTSSSPHDYSVCLIPETLLVLVLVLTCSYHVASVHMFFLSADVYPRKDLVKRGLTEPSQALPEVTLTCICPSPWEVSSLLWLYMRNFL